MHDTYLLTYAALMREINYRQYISPERHACLLRFVLLELRVAWIVLRFDGC